MCDTEKASQFGPESFNACDDVLVELDKLAPEGEPTSDQWQEAVAKVHGDPREEGDKYDDHPDV